MSDRKGKSIRKADGKVSGAGDGPPPAAPTPGSIESARAAGLRYVTDTSPGIVRRKAKSGFTYVSPAGRVVRDADTLARIKALVIPPAWRDIWICPDPRGHIQAVGRDDRGRKQYRYHERWRAVRDEDKYGRMMEFVRALPRVRRRVRKDMKQPGLPREKVLAAVVRLLETTFIRVGNAEYKKSNQSYGLTTMLDGHAKIRGRRVQFNFRGKSGVAHAIDLEDPRLAKIIKGCQELPGEELFAYVDGRGNARDVGSGDVNDYLREITGRDFTAKDFRTWAGTVLAATALRAMEAVDSDARRKKNVVAAVESVAKRLGNTRAVCRKCYIHPAVIDSYLDGSFLDAAGERAARMLKSAKGLRPDEAEVLDLLQRRLTTTAKRQKRGKAA